MALTQKNLDELIAAAVSFFKRGTWYTGMCEKPLRLSELEYVPYEEEEDQDRLFKSAFRT